jgi:hypothetical protein
VTFPKQKGTAMQEAYRIVDWWRYEMTSKGRLAKPETPMDQLRIAPLIYVRFPVHGHSLTARYRRMIKRAWNHGDLMAEACVGVYKMLVALAAGFERERRGWILDDRGRPINPAQVAELLSLSPAKMNTIFEVLMDPDVGWIELAKFPDHLLNIAGPGVRIGNLAPIPGSPGKSGPDGVPLNEAETEETKRFDSKRIEIESFPGSPGKSGPDGVGHTGTVLGSGDDLGTVARGVVESIPQAQAPAPVTGSASNTVTDSKDFSDTVPVPDSDSTFEPGPGPGGDQAGRERLFEISRQMQKAKFDMDSIIACRTNSDRTTVTDIFAQLQQRIISGCQEPLFDMSLTMARHCVQVADKPMAMWVSAMKKQPFCYVPKKVAVLPGDDRPHTPRYKHNR